MCVPCVIVTGVECILDLDSQQTNNAKKKNPVGLRWAEAGVEMREDAVSKLNKQNHENIVALTDGA